MERFTQLNDKDLCFRLFKNNIYQPTQVQKESIPIILKNKNALIISNPGSGKTLIFAIACYLLLKNNQNSKIVILSPTRELCQQTMNVINTINTYQSKIILTQNEIQNIEDDSKIIITTINKFKTIIKNKINFTNVIIDEFDELIQKEILFQVFNSLPQETVYFLFSATYNQQSINILQNHLKIDNVVHIENDSQQLKYYIIQTEDPILFLINLIKKSNFVLALIFMNSVDKIEEFTEQNKDLGIISLHSHLDIQTRQQNLQLFQQGKKRILITSDIMARGMDIRSINLVINFDIPINNEQAIHRAGRASRSGRQGTVVSIANNTDQVKELQKLYPKSIIL